MADHQTQRTSMRNSNGHNGVSDVTFDLLSILHNKLEAAAAYEQYRADAEQAGDSDVKQLVQEVAESDAAHIQRLKSVLADRLSRSIT